MSDSEFWYCIKHSRVEGHDGCPNKERLGPYATEAEASRALETAAERTEAWDKESDSGWDDEQLED
ncbi:hypothetical protein [Nocardioides sp.]|uniref:hypothetical protein n=1 Tax=Nocardioides sp. TaxID=35761 RepID=UPI00286B8D72|nr:hypothetical protein [Nocardioides sp.]